jgi:CcmD family protein
LSPFDKLRVTVLIRAPVLIKDVYPVDYVIYAYMLIWAVFFGYVFLLGRRITKLEQDIASFRK